MKESHSSVIDVPDMKIDIFKGILSLSSKPFFSSIKQNLFFVIKNNIEKFKEFFEKAQRFFCHIFFF